MTQTNVTQVEFGWNKATPLNVVVVTTDTASELIVRDTNGAPLVGYRLLRLDGPALSAELLVSAFATQNAVIRLM